MTDDRKATIINELNFWKKNKMLPVVYCDYLLALYTNGDEVVDDDKEIDEDKNSSSILGVGKLLLLILLVPFALIVTYTSYFPSYFQLGILLLFILYSFWQFKVWGLKQGLFYHLSFSIWLLLIFLTTTFLSNTYFYLPWITPCIIIMNFLFWFILGRKAELKYLLFASFFGILVTVLFFVL